MKRQRQNQNGFTLIELLAFIAIIVLIAAILFPVFASARGKARQISFQSDDEIFPLGLHLAPGADGRVRPIPMSHQPMSEGIYYVCSSPTTSI